MKNYFNMNLGIAITLVCISGTSLATPNLPTAPDSIKMDDYYKGKFFTPALKGERRVLTKDGWEQTQKLKTAPHDAKIISRGLDSAKHLAATNRGELVAVLREWYKNDPEKLKNLDKMSEKNLIGLAERHLRTMVKFSNVNALEDLTRLEIMTGKGPVGSVIHDTLSGMSRENLLKYDLELRWWSHGEGVRANTSLSAEELAADIKKRLFSKHLLGQGGLAQYTEQEIASYFKVQQGLLAK